MNYDTWKTTEPLAPPGPPIPGRLRFAYACDGLRLAVARACCPSERHSDDLWHEADAVWFARHVAHEARRLGLLCE